MMLAQLHRETAACQFLGSAPTSGNSVPDHREKTGDMTQQVLQETNDILATVGPVLDTQIQVPVGSDAADGREVIPCERHLQDRSLSSGSIGAHHRGEQVEAALVHPEDGSSLAQASSGSGPCGAA
jgi:hypothetical protein